MVLPPYGDPAMEGRATAVTNEAKGARPHKARGTAIGAMRGTPGDGRPGYNGWHGIRLIGHGFLTVKYRLRCWLWPSMHLEQEQSNLYDFRAPGLSLSAPAFTPRSARLYRDRTVAAWTSRTTALEAVPASSSSASMNCHK